MSSRHETQPTDHRFAVGLGIVLLVYSVSIHLIPGYTALYVPLGLVGTGLLWLAAHRAGLTRDDLGLAADRAIDGLRLGGVVGLLAVGVLAIGVVVPAFHPLLEDERVGDIGFGLLAYRTLVRIPLGTVLLEEFAFRGVLFGAWQRSAGRPAAIAGSSAIFGLWHVRPAAELIEINSVEASATAATLLIVGAVVFTGLAGVFFCWLRIRSGSLLAPIVAHTIVNSAATVAAFTVFRW